MSSNPACDWYQDKAKAGDLGLFPGQILGGRYAVRDFLGRGGFGCVIQVEDSGDHSTKVVKVFVGDKKNSDDIELFRREFWILKKLHDQAGIKHAKHLPRVYGEVFDAPSGPAFAMEYLESFDEQLKKVPPEWLDGFAKEFICEICDVLSELHAHGIFHRDIKMENVMYRVSEDAPSSGTPVLIDFGIAIEPGDDELRRKLLLHSGTAGDADRTQFEQPLTDMSREDISKAIDIFSIGNLIGDVFATRNEVDAKRKQRFRSYNLQPPVPPQWLRIESVCRARKWWDRYPDVITLKEAILNRGLSYRKWIKNSAAMMRICDEQHAVDCKYLQDGVRPPNGQRQPSLTAEYSVAFK